MLYSAKNPDESELDDALQNVVSTLFHHCLKLLPCSIVVFVCFNVLTSVVKPFLADGDISLCGRQGCLSEVLLQNARQEISASQLSIR